MTEGECLCGAVRLRARGRVGEDGARHRAQRRRRSRHRWAATRAASRDVEITGDAPAWFPASDAARRGFWQPADGETIDVALGAVGGPTGLRLERHIAAAGKGDDHEIADGLPQHPPGSDDA